MKKSFTPRQILTAIYIAALTFFSYASVYAFRKPFTIATFDGEKLFGISYQTIFIISQVIGYMLSKFSGIKFISSLKRNGRWKSALFLIGTAWLSLLAFAILPLPFGILCFFVNGYMLGFMWGIVFGYAEGRRSSDFIGSVLAVSFIFAGGFTRSVAKWLMLTWDITEKWMPFMTGLLFVAPLFILIFLLELVAPPDEADIQERVERISMTKDDRKAILQKFGLGLTILVVVYTALTIIRDVRDNFMSTIWAELGYANDFSVFTTSETKISLAVLLVMSLIVLIRKNILAFQIIQVLVICGFLVSGISSYLFLTHRLDGALWMQAVGLGLYMAYIPFNAIFFERMIAAFRISGNVGFLIYITDAFGYLGSVVVMLTKESLKIKLLWSVFYSLGVVVFSIIGIIGTLYSVYYFNKKYKSQAEVV